MAFSLLPLNGTIRVTCEYGRKGNWKAGWHTGIDMVNDDRIVYATCNGTVYNMGYDASYGNFIVVKADNGLYHWYCHLAKITCSLGETVSPVRTIGEMGDTGNATGVHLHYEIRNTSNRYSDTRNPAEYMGIPNQVGTYRESDYQVGNNTPILKTLRRNTYLRNEPTTESMHKTLYISNTTLYVLNSGVAENDGYTWDYVKIRVTGQYGYMINKNYK